MPARITPSDRREFERCLEEVRHNPRVRVCLVSTFAVHFGDRRAEHVERAVFDAVNRAAPGRCVVLRTGNVVQPPSRSGRLARWAAAWHPLVSTAFRSCYATEAELSAAVRDLTDPDAPFGSRVVTILGANRPLRDVWAERAARDPVGRLFTVVAYVLQWLLIGHAISLVFAAAARWSPSLRRWRCRTIEPQSVRELLALYNPWSRRHVVLAGYNTGVDHFGWKFAGRTVVKTVGCARRIRLRNDGRLVVDAGATIKRCVVELDKSDRQLPVLPNYSYVSMGTAFFVPIHGSGTVSTLGDAIEEAVLYDPHRDCIIAVRRGEPDFNRTMYAANSGMLALRLQFRTQPKAQYFMRRYVVDAPTAEDVWRLFDDPDASNIELRKATASGRAVTVSKFYENSARDDGLLEVPRDAIGRLWDRLEENRLTSLLFHGLVRRFAFHVELFLDRDEFAVFWEAHGELPLRKLQLRFVHRDGLPESPFGLRDCISVDLFMSRRVRSIFLDFIQEKLPHARFNRGKHSM